MSVHDNRYVKMLMVSSIPRDFGSSAPPPGLTQEAIQALAQEAGFTAAGAVALPYPETDRDATRFEEWIEEGRSGGMDYLARRNDAGELIRSRAQLPFPWARSAIVCLAGYHADAPLSVQPAPPDAGWIARYAWSGKRDAQGNLRPSDYHKVLLKRLHALEVRMHAAFGDFECRAYVDTGPVVERSLARAAGLGWTGKNTCLIHPKLGSWNFLAVLLTSLPLPQKQAVLAVPDRCGTCRRCLDACPTQALTEPYRMDASRCISYLTIEHKGVIPEEFLTGIGRQVFGCDICQDVCPWNRKAPVVAQSGSGLAARPELVNPPLEWLAELDFETFERLFNGSPVRRTGHEGLLRNVAVAMGNSGSGRFAPWLERWASGHRVPDSAAAPSGKASANLAGLRAAAQWALRRIALVNHSAQNTGQAQGQSGNRPGGE